MDAATIIALIEQGFILLPQFEAAWSNLQIAFNSSDKAAIDAALAAAKAKDAADTAAYDALP